MYCWIDATCIDILRALCIWCVCVITKLAQLKNIDRVYIPCMRQDVQQHMANLHLDQQQLLHLE